MTKVSDKMPVRFVSRDWLPLPSAKPLVAIVIGILTSLFGPQASARDLACTAFFRGNSERHLPVSEEAMARLGKLEPEWAEALSAPPDAKGVVTTTRKVPMLPATLVKAYRRFVFPWNTEKAMDPATERLKTVVALNPLTGQAEEVILWTSPPKRGILPLGLLRPSKTDFLAMERLLREGYAVTFNKAFREVMIGCAEASRLQWNMESNSYDEEESTWIKPVFIDQYTALHELGIAHSVEVWSPEGQLVGGVYGLLVDGVFSGESMFHTRPNVAKLAFMRLNERLYDLGFMFMDVQAARPDSGSLTVKWGAYEIPREEFERLALAERARLYELHGGPPKFSMDLAPRTIELLRKMGRTNNGPRTIQQIRGMGRTTDGTGPQPPFRSVAAGAAATGIAMPPPASPAIQPSAELPSREVANKPQVEVSTQVPEFADSQ
jgi:leucyl/phenylalanyl-tRNA--protein transferase